MLNFWNVELCQFDKEIMPCNMIHLLANPSMDTDYPTSEQSKS